MADEFRIDRLYPIEGDSAVAELWFGGAVWAQLELEGIELGAVGRDRTRHVTERLHLFPAPTGLDNEWWSFHLSDVQDQLALAKAWLLENEQGRLPVEPER